MADKKEDDVYSFISPEKFNDDLNNLNKEGEAEYLLSFFDDHCEGRFYDVMSDYTGDSYTEDEQNYVDDKSRDELYSEMAEDHKKWLLNRVRNRFSEGELFDLMSDNEKVELKHINKILLVVKGL